MRLRSGVLAVACLTIAVRASAQQGPALTREAAIASAIERGGRLRLAVADTATAFAQWRVARTFENPVLSAQYTKSAPQYHVTLDLPFDYPWLRGTRVAAAEATRAAARYRYAFERAAVALDADTTYTRAIAAQEKLRLSRRNAADADSLRRIAVARREAGDASDLDVELATVSAGQQANVAAADSLTWISALLDLQTVIGHADAEADGGPHGLARRAVRLHRGAHRSTAADRRGGSRAAVRIARRAPAASKSLCVHVAHHRRRGTRSEGRRARSAARDRLLDSIPALQPKRRADRGRGGRAVPRTGGA